MPADGTRAKINLPWHGDFGRYQHGPIAADKRNIHRPEWNWFAALCGYKATELGQEVSASNLQFFTPGAAGFSQCGLLATVL